MITIIANNKGAYTGQPVLPQNWEMHVSGDGKIYYAHTTNGISQWELPMLPSNWREARQESGHMYYYNEVTNVTTWYWPGRQHQKGLMSSSIQEKLRKQKENRSEGTAGRQTLNVVQALEVQKQVALMDAGQQQEGDESRKISDEDFDESPTQDQGVDIKKQQEEILEKQKSSTQEGDEL